MEAAVQLDIHIIFLTVVRAFYVYINFCSYPRFLGQYYQYGRTYFLGYLVEILKHTSTKTIFSEI